MDGISVHSADRLSENLQIIVLSVEVITEDKPMSMNKYGGVNDMPDGFTKTELGKRIYALWFGILRRCYDVNQLNRKRGKSYSNVVVCDRWFYLKNFVEDIKELEGYKEWTESNTMALDKDIIAQEVTKIYSPKTCKFVTKTENMQEMNTRCNTVEIAQDAIKTIYVLFAGDEYHVFDTEKDACVFLGVKQCSVSGAWYRKVKCKGYNVIRIGNHSEMEADHEIRDCD